MFSTRRNNADETRSTHFSKSARIAIPLRINVYFQECENIHDDLSLPISVAGHCSRRCSVKPIKGIQETILWGTIRLFLVFTTILFEFMMPRHRKIILALVLVAAVCAILFLVKGEDFLRINREIKGGHTDAVVVLAGSYKEDKERIAKGTALIQQGKGQILILPLRHPAIDWPWVVQYFGLRDELPENLVLIGRSTPEDEPIIEKFGGTYVEARKTVQIMQKLNLTSAIIVSSAYHMRRAQMAFDRYRPSTQIEFYYHPVEIDSKRKRMWWLDTKYVGKILQEYKKVMAALFIYNSSPDPAL